MEKLTGIERKYKNSRFYNWDVFNRRVAEKLMAMGKYMYYIEDKPHWKTGKKVKTYCFESTDEIKEDIKKIKEELYNKKADKNVKKDM